MTSWQSTMTTMPCAVYSSMNESMPALSWATVGEGGGTQMRLARTMFQPHALASAACPVAVPFQLNVYPFS